MKNPLNETRAFSRELDAWVREGIISGDQASELRARYSRPESETSGRLGLILKAAAALLTGMGMFLLISANWHRIGIAGRMGMGLVPLLATYGLGVFFITRRKFTTAGAWFLLSSILLGVNIFLQAQIFHLSGRLPDAFLWWMLGSLPAAMYFRTPGHNVLLQVLYLIWVGLEVEKHSLSPHGLIVLVISGYLLFRTGDKAMDPERDRAPGRFALFLWALNLVLTITALDKATPGSPWFGWFMPALAGVFLVFALLCVWRNSAVQHFLDQMRGLTAMLIALSLLIFALPEPAAAIHLMPPSWTAYGTVLLAASLMTAAYFRLEKSEERRAFLKANAWTGVIVAYLFIVQAILFPYLRNLGSPAWSVKTIGNGISILSSVVLLACAIILVFQGIRDAAKRPFMTGIFLIIALAMARYLEYFNDYVLAAGVFIFCGVLLVILNFAWTKLYTEEKNAH